MNQTAKNSFELHYLFRTWKLKEIEQRFLKAVTNLLVTSQPPIVNIYTRNQQLTIVAQFPTFTVKGVFVQNFVQLGSIKNISQISATITFEGEQKELSDIIESFKHHYFYLMLKGGG